MSSSPRIKASIIVNLNVSQNEKDYFKSYLNRLSNYNSELYQFYNIRENPEHLLLHCKRYSQIRKKIKQEKQLNQLFLKILFSLKSGQDFLFKFLKETNIATRK